MMRFCEDGIGRILSGTYYIPQVGRDSHVPSYIEEALGDVIAHHTAKLKELPEGPLYVNISTDDARRLDAITGNSIDYIFTDPPYAGKEQYGELNFVWEAWLSFDTHWLDEEITVNEVRGKTEVDWAEMTLQAMAECYRVLKPGRWLSLCYHDTSEGTWELLQDIMAEAGFVAESGDTALFIETTQKTHNQIHADKVNKRDLVINFRKPQPGELGGRREGKGEKRTFREEARDIIREYLLAHPGASKDRIYDELVSRMVRAGQMQSHNFDEILREVAEEVKEPRKKNLFENEDPDLFGSHTTSRWYLKESEESALDEAESALEDVAAQVMTSFIEKRLKEDPSREGVHYSDLFEHYIYTVKEKPRRQLADWLLDYFYKTPEGTYRLPADETEAKAKAEARASGVHRQSFDIAVLATFMGIPKEGPSAGITIVTGTVSALTGRRVRNDLAMTGEITIMGKVLPVGGVQQKLRAACEAGVKEVLIPAENMREAEGLPTSIRKQLKISPVQTIEEVLSAALFPS